MEHVEVKIERRGLEADIDRQDFAYQLLTWRIRTGRTQKEVAELFGCSRYTIIDIEKAKPIGWRMAYRVFARFAEQLRKENQP